MDSFTSNTLNAFGFVMMQVWFAMKQVAYGASWLYKQDYAGIYDNILSTREQIGIACLCLLLAQLAFMYYVYMPATVIASKEPRPNKRSLPETEEEQSRNIKRRVSIQADKYSHAAAFQTIQSQVGEDLRSWPVILLNEVILLREDIARLQKTE
jgi:hypothetical protein